jgi:hypothetical protein
MKRLAPFLIMVALCGVVVAENIPQGCTKSLTFFLADGNAVAMTGKTVVPFVSKNGGAFAAAAGTCFEVAKGYYRLDGNITDTNTQGVLIIEANYPASLTGQNIYFVDGAKDANVRDIAARLEVALAGIVEANQRILALTNIVNWLDANETARHAARPTLAQIWGEANRSLTARDLFTLAVTPPTAAAISTWVWGEANRSLTARNLFSLAVAPPTQAEIWGESNRSLTQLASMAPGGVFSAGSLVNAPGGATVFDANYYSTIAAGPDPNQIADSVWRYRIAAAAGTGTASTTITGIAIAAPTGTKTIDGNTLTAAKLPIEGAKVEISTDSAKANVVRIIYTNSFGYWHDIIDPGTYYLWVTKSGYTFVNPTTKVVAP